MTRGACTIWSTDMAKEVQAGSAHSLLLSSWQSLKCSNWYCSWHCSPYRRMWANNCRWLGRMRAKIRTSFLPMEQAAAWCRFCCFQTSYSNSACALHQCLYLWRWTYCTQSACFVSASNTLMGSKKQHASGCYSRTVSSAKQCASTRSTWHRSRLQGCTGWHRRSPRQEQSSASTWQQLSSLQQRFRKCSSMRLSTYHIGISGCAW